MIRLPPQNRECPVQLLDYDDASQLVRQRERPEAPGSRCAADQCCVEAVGPSDDEGQRPGCKHPTVQLFGEVCTGPSRAHSCERYEAPCRRNARRQPLRFLQPLGGDVWSSTRLPHLVFSKDGIPLDPSPIVIESFAVIGPQLADSDQVDLQWSAKPLTHTSRAAGARLRPARSPACTPRFAC
jgi:hypothetical protein